MYGGGNPAVESGVQPFEDPSSTRVFAPVGRPEVRQTGDSEYVALTPRK